MSAHLRQQNLTMERIYELPAEGNRKVRLSVKVVGWPEDSERASAALEDVCSFVEQWTERETTGVGA